MDARERADRDPGLKAKAASPTVSWRITRSAAPQPPEHPTGVSVRTIARSLRVSTGKWTWCGRFYAQHRGHGGTEHTMPLPPDLLETFRRLFLAHQPPYQAWMQPAGTAAKY